MDDNRCFQSRKYKGIKSDLSGTKDANDSTASAELFTQFEAAEQTKLINI